MTAKLIPLHVAQQLADALVSARLLLSTAQSEVHDDLWDTEQQRFYEAQHKALAAFDQAREVGVVKAKHTTRYYEAARAELLKIWPKGIECEHQHAREAFIALDRAESEMVKLRLPSPDFGYAVPAFHQGWNECARRYADAIKDQGIDVEV